MELPQRDGAVCGVQRFWAGLERSATMIGTENTRESVISSCLRLTLSVDATTRLPPSG